MGPPLSSDAASWRTSVATNHTSQTQITYSYIQHLTSYEAVGDFDLESANPFTISRTSLRTHNSEQDCKLKGLLVCIFRFAHPITSEMNLCLSSTQSGSLSGEDGKKERFPLTFILLSDTHTHTLTIKNDLPWVFSSSFCRRFVAVIGKHSSS